MARVAYCTLLTSDTFLPGLQVMVFSLQATGTKVPLVVLVTAALSEHTLTKLRATAGLIVKPVPDIANPNEDVHVEGWVNSG
jgi:hypothetical protein